MSLKSSKRQQREPLSRDERSRLFALTAFEEKAYQAGYKSIAGVDEAGRGPLAGPVVAAACILPRGLLIEGVDDSKKLTAAKRAELYDTIAQDPSICYGIGIVSQQEIDRINILQATIVAMFTALSNLSTAPDYILCDGMQLPHEEIPVEKIVKGDSRSHTIAAASILAKVTRDRLMLKYHEKWPQYGFDLHKGYGTAKHREALEKYGPCALHRKTFEPVKKVCTR